MTSFAKTIDFHLALCFWYDIQLLVDVPTHGFYTCSVFQVLTASTLYHGSAKSDPLELVIYMYVYKLFVPFRSIAVTGLNIYEKFYTQVCSRVICNSITKTTDPL